MHMYNVHAYKLYMYMYMCTSILDHAFTSYLLALRVNYGSGQSQVFAQSHVDRQSLTQTTDTQVHLHTAESRLGRVGVEVERLPLTLGGDGAQ